MRSVKPAHKNLQGTNIYPNVKQSHRILVIFGSAVLCVCSASNPQAVYLQCGREGHRHRRSFFRRRCRPAAGPPRRLHPRQPFHRPARPFLSRPRQPRCVPRHLEHPPWDKHSVSTTTMAAVSCGSGSDVSCRWRSHPACSHSYLPLCWGLYIRRRIFGPGVRAIHPDLFSGHGGCRAKQHSHAVVHPGGSGPRPSVHPGWLQ